MISRNRIAAHLYDDVGWTTFGPGATALAHHQERPCGCGVTWFLYETTLTWVWSLDWICAEHAAVK